MQNATAFSAWAEGIHTVAQQDNVYCKLSGLPQSYGAPGWSAQAFKPYVNVVLQEFGAERVNFAGNWFVLTDEQWEGTYPTMLAAVTQTLSDLDVTDEDMSTIMYDCAYELYGLGDKGSLLRG